MVSEVLALGGVRSTGYAVLLLLLSGINCLGKITVVDDYRGTRGGGVNKGVPPYFGGDLVSEDFVCQFFFCQPRDSLPTEVETSALKNRTIPEYHITSPSHTTRYSIFCRPPYSFSHATRSVP